jgi:FlaA1/EpsC-like NDP-sugar epimerase
MKAHLLDHLLRRRRLITEALGAAIVSAALASSFLLRFEFAVPPAYIPMLLQALPLALLVKMVVFRAFGLRDLAWRYIGFDDLLRIGGAHLAASAGSGLLLRFWVGPELPRSIYLLDWLLCLTLEIGTRAAIRILFDARLQGNLPESCRVLIFGAGKAGAILATELRSQSALGYYVAGFLDDDPVKRDMRVNGIRIYGGRCELAAVAEKLSIDQVLIALPNGSGQDLSEILEECQRAGVQAKRIPALSEMMDSKVLVSQMREVRIEDLLGRAPAQLDDSEVRRRIHGQVVLVTGAGGSIGSELCRQIARYQPSALVGLDHAETALYDIEQELRSTFPDVPFYPEVGSVQNRQRLDEVFRTHLPHSVYHAAAYKHVPLMEAHMFEAVKNNVFGTRNVARAVARWGVADFVIISTDKAVRPTNIMGATKRVAELVCLMEGRKPSTVPGAVTKTVAVRFGNVLGSNGSVIPRFRQQIAKGGPVTVTHPEMRRFFMTIPEAAQLVLQAGAMGEGSEVFVLEMGESVRILDLARKMIVLSGLRPDVDIPITFSGSRPGEKLYEELSAYEENTVPTPHAQIRVFCGVPPEKAAFAQSINGLRIAVETRDAAGLVMALKELVPDYNPSNSVLHTALRAKAKRNAA